MHSWMRLAQIYKVQSEIIHCNEHSDHALNRSLAQISSNENFYFDFLHFCKKISFYLNCLYRLFFRNLPQAKHARASSSSSSSSFDYSRPSTGTEQVEVPHVLQGEIARLDHKFRVGFDHTVQIGAKTLKLVCYLNDPYLTCVPPIFIEIPDDYPLSPPTCSLLEHEMNATKFLESVQQIFAARMLKMPSLYSLSHVLDTWEMAIRQACSPNINPSKISATSVALGI